MSVNNGAHLLSQSFCVNYLLKYADGDIEGIKIGMVLVAAMALSVLLRLLTTAYMLIQGIYIGK